MTGLRRWQLQASQNLPLPLAADARLQPTDYSDDQVWQLAPSAGPSPALALQTNYGGRVGLATLVPMWTYENRIIYEAQAYARPPIIAHFAPGYMLLRATLLPKVELQAEYWVIDSHTIGGQFKLKNNTAQPITLQLDMFGHVGAQGKEQSLHIVPVGDNGHALHLGQISKINPVVILADGQAQIVGGEAVSPKIGRESTIAAGTKTTFQWVHAGLASVQESIEQAQRWLQTDWRPHLRKMQRAAQAIPNIETGEDANRSNAGECLSGPGNGFFATDWQPSARFISHPS